ncbi:ABC transporter permease [Geobacter grbiciae]|uniref:ABC transporter permease n=1 Tax=Geobacter grbiciae TaxID=155042 RepID=UPI001C009F91|nr:ABC transporter permease [Geobacter grbiciae]MBT1074021.1 ABC transporter permease [Geobacter grbiciae]
MFERIREMVIKEFSQVFRDRRMKAIIFVTPILQLLMFGYAVTTDVKNITTAVYDLDRSYESRELARRLESSGYFTITSTPASPEELGELIDRGKVLAAVQVNRGFGRDLARGIPTEVQVIVDGTDSNTASVAMDYATRVIARFGKDMGSRAMTRPLAKTGRVDLRPRAWYNPDLRSRNYNVPGVIAIIIMLTSLLLTAMAVVREREIGTMEQLMVTPLKPVELILGKTIPFAVISFFDMALVTTVGVFWFGIPIKGSLPLLTLATGIYLLSVLGVGLFISTISRTQQQALMATFLFYIPAVLLSGFMFPIENMPEAIQYGTFLNPLRYFLVIIRGIFLKGNGIGVLWPQMAALLALGVAVMSLSALRFRKRLG